MKFKKIRGFTLMELLVVIGIIGILVAMGTVSYSSAQKRSRDSRRKTDLETVSKALEQYNADNNGVYPSGNDCVGYEGFLSSSSPTDPKFGYTYTSDSNTQSGAGITGSYCDGVDFCLCVLLESTGTGNGDGKTDTTCNFSANNNGDYHCIQGRL